ncbi:hypothetical protein LMG26684_04221 [Achromobacter mucicolens]|uniref:Uncharacterized protein n=1 Tax=Achromobacter aegrifaciens TaxID=1287736 RepID=A0AAD2KLX7_ACHAE|nr:hypothetical protein LMG26684_04221 [Achromobacter mucicolens]CUJ71144.1 Uncharacterised protein [Achromobacter aegrifaciens]
MPHVSLLRKNHIPLMGKNPLSLESTHISARSRSHFPHVRAPNVASSPLAAALARIPPARLRTQAPVRPGAHSPATGSPAGLRTPVPLAALASPHRTNAPPVHPLCRGCAPYAFVPEGFGKGRIQHRVEPPFDAFRARMSTLRGGLTCGDATQAVHTASAAWSLMVGSVLGATGAVAFLLWINRAIGGPCSGASPRAKSPHKVAFASGIGFTPAHPWCSADVISAFLRGV